MRSSEHSAELWDGTSIFYRAWLPPAPTTKALILFHRGHEHSGRYEDLVRRLGLEDVAVFAWDQRGHGRSPGIRGWAPSFASLVKDADSFVRFISAEHSVPIDNTIVMGHSVGAVLVSAWVHDYAPPIRAMALVTPAFRVKLYVPFAIPSLRLLRRVKRKSFVKSYVRSTMITHDAEQAAEYDRDPLISRNIAVNILLDLHDTATRIMADAAVISTPTLLLSAGSDWVVHRSSQRRFFDRLGSNWKQMETYDGFYHAILHEKDRDRPIARLRRFIDEAYETPLHRATFQSTNPPRTVSPVKKFQFALSKLFLKTIGKLSAGIRIGWSAGFDSGRSLDHVYQNRASGVTPIGRVIDRIYLNSPGWKGIRQRKVNLESLLERAIRQVYESKRPVRLLDIAAGPGRYILDTIKRLNNVPISATLRDRDAKGLQAGREIAAQMNIDSVMYETGDAFDRLSLATIRPRPTIAIVSGLYELFGDNQRVQNSLYGLHEALEDGGLLIYTNQPWHPQLDFIANVLINRNGDPWVMRCRPQAEMDGLVRSAGFEKIAMEIDDQGIFSVALARKI